MRTFVAWQDQIVIPLFSTVSLSLPKKLDSQTLFGQWPSDQVLLLLNKFPDGGEILVACGDRIFMYDPKTGSCTKTMRGKPPPFYTL